MEDIVELKKIGIKEIFTSGTDTNRIIEFIKEMLKLSDRHRRDNL